MKLQLQRPHRSDVRLVLFYWLLAAPIIFFSYQRQYGVGRGVAGILYTILLDSGAVYLLVFGFLPLALARQNPLVLFAGLVGFVLADAHCYWLGYHLLFDPRPWQWSFLGMLSALVHHTQSYGCWAFCWPASGTLMCKSAFCKRRKPKRKASCAT